MPAFSDGVAVLEAAGPSRRASAPTRRSPSRSWRSPRHASARPRTRRPTGGERQQGVDQPRARSGAGRPCARTSPGDPHSSSARSSAAPSPARAHAMSQWIGRVQVGVVAAGPPHGLDLPGRPEVHGQVAREGDEVVRRERGGAPPPRRSRGAARPRTRGSSRAARSVRPGSDHAHEPLLDQRVELVQRARTLVRPVADLLHRLEGPALVEDREPAQQPLLPRVEERIAPADRRAKGPLPERQVAIAGGQEVESVVEALQQQPRARGCARARPPVRGRAAGRRGRRQIEATAAAFAAVSAKPGLTFAARCTKSGYRRAAA